MPREAIAITGYWDFLKVNLSTVNAAQNIDFLGNYKQSPSVKSQVFICISGTYQWQQDMLDRLVNSQVKTMYNPAGRSI